MRSTEDIVHFPPRRRRDPSSGFAQPILRGIADTLFRHRLLIASLVALLTAAFAAFLILNPREYDSEVTFLVRNNRADLVVSPDTLPASAQRMMPDVSDAQIATEVQMLSSRDLAIEVLNQIGYGPEVRTAIEREKALNLFRKKLQITPVMKSDMIRVRFSSPSAERSTRALDVLSKAYLDRHLRLHGNSGSFAFFEQQAADAERQLKDAQRDLVAFQQKAGITSAAEEKTLLLQRSVDLQVLLNQAEAELKDTCRRAGSLKPRLNTMSPRIATQMRRMPNQYSIERLNTLLTELQNRKTELLTKFRPGDRMVVQIDQQIADTRSALDVAEHRIATEEASDVNPVRQGVESDLTRTEVSLAGLRGRIQAMKGQRADYRAELKRLEKLLPLEQERIRNAKVAEDNYMLYAKKREEARIGERLDRQKIANVVIAEPASAPLLPKPRLGPAVISAYLLGLILIMLLALMLGRIGRTVFTPWELEAIAEVPVLGTVPVRPALAASLAGRRS